MIAVQPGAQPVTNVAQALDAARSQGIDRLEAQLLLLHALGRPANERAWLLAHDTDALPGSSVLLFLHTCQRRVGGEPLAYITGAQAFFGLQLAVDRRVLVPRPDTESLVEWALALLRDTAVPAPRILDLGTGSGAIALALAQQLKEFDRAAHITAVDISQAALEVASANASTHGLAGCVEFKCGNWLQGVHGPFDLIVSNPPYIAAADPHLTALSHEPLQALASGADGLDDICLIIEQARGQLAPGGWLLLEHGYDQAERVRDLLGNWEYAPVQSRRDLAGHERCSGGLWQGPKNSRIITS